MRSSVVILILLIIVSSVYADLTTGLVAHYPFNGNANDESGNGYDGTVNGASLTEDRFNNISSSYYFDGNDDITFGDILDIVFESDTFSISVWCKRDADCNDNGMIIEKWYDYTTNSNSAFVVFPDRFQTIGTGTPYNVLFPVLDTETWVNLTLTILNGNLNIYQNSSLVSSDTNINCNPSEKPLMVGGFWAHLSNYYFKGKIDDVRIYDRAISTSEIEELYHLNGWDESFPDLVAYYPFNGNADDESGNGLHGTVNGAAPAIDRFGNNDSAYQFDGDDDYIENIGGLPGITDQVSISFWIYKPGNYEDDYQKILLTGDAPSNYGINFSQGELVTPFYFEINNDSSLITTDYPSADEWHHIVGVYNGSNVEFFIDKFSKGSNTCSGNVIPLSPLRIGWGYNLEYFQGKIDDVRIYDRAISTSEIEELYHLNGWDNLGSGLVAHYPFSGNAYDGSGNGNHGSVNGAAPASDRFGNNNSAYQFDGVDDYLQCNHIDATTFGENESFSFSYWFFQENADIPIWNGSISKMTSANPARGYQSGIKENKIVFEYRAGSVANPNVIHVFDTVEYVPDLWYNVVAICDKQNDQITLYVNGEEKAVYNASWISESSADSNYLYFGRLRGTPRYWMGKIDDIRIYDRVLSEAEITELYNVGGWLSDPENIIIEISIDNVQISWNEVTGATSYKVYSFTDPYAAESWTFEEEVTESNWSEPATPDKKFYYVKAVN